MEEGGSERSLVFISFNVQSTSRGSSALPTVKYGKNAGRAFQKGHVQPQNPLRRCGLRRRAAKEGCLARLAKAKESHTHPGVELQREDQISFRSTCQVLPIFIIAYGEIPKEAGHNTHAHAKTCTHTRIKAQRGTIQMVRGQLAS